MDTYKEYEPYLLGIIVWSSNPLRRFMRDYTVTSK